MQKCSYCGKDNGDAAMNCFECGTELEKAIQVRRETEANQSQGTPSIGGTFLRLPWFFIPTLVFLLVLPPHHGIRTLLAMTESGYKEVLQLEINARTFPGVSMIIPLDEKLRGIPTLWTEPIHQPLAINFGRLFGELVLCGVCVVLLGLVGQARGRFRFNLQFGWICYCLVISALMFLRHPVIAASLQPGWGVRTSLIKLLNWNYVPMNAGWEVIFASIAAAGAAIAMGRRVEQRPLEAIGVEPPPLLTPPAPPLVATPDRLDHGRAMGVACIVGAVFSAIGLSQGASGVSAFAGIAITFGNGFIFSGAGFTFGYGLGRLVLLLRRAWSDGAMQRRASTGPPASPSIKNAVALSIAAPLLALVGGLLCGLMFQYNQSAWWVGFIVSTMLAVAGLCAGIFSLAAMKRCNPRGVFGPALFGIIFSGFMVLMAFAAILMMQIR